LPSLALRNRVLTKLVRDGSNTAGVGTAKQADACARRGAKQITEQITMNTSFGVLDLLVVLISKGIAFGRTRPRPGPDGPKA
jgi:hypothetical protein